LGQGLSDLGRSIIYVAVALYVYDITGSAREVALAVTLELLPWVIVGPLVGAMADRLDRKRMLVLGFLIQAGLVALIPFTTNLTQVYVLLFLSSLSAPVTSLVWTASIPAIVAGPILGGWLVTLVGAKPTFFVVVACLLGAAALSSTAIVPGPRTQQLASLGLSTIRADLASGLRFLKGNPILRYLLLLSCVATLGWSVPNIAAVAYVTDDLGLGGGVYGLLRGILSLSTAIGVYVLGGHFRILPRQVLLVGGILLAGLTYVLMLAEPLLLPLMALWFISGLGWAAFWLSGESLWAQLVPDEIRGRVFSLADAIIHLVEAGTAIVGGWLVSVRGPVEAIFIVGASMAIGSVLLSVVSGGYQDVARLDNAEEPASGE
jgi:NRE family putative nickel resistance protein-like MFS transporter